MGVQTGLQNFMPGFYCSSFSHPIHFFTIINNTKLHSGIPLPSKEWAALGRRGERGRGRSCLPEKR